MPELSAADHPDLIGGPSTDKLAGATIEYRYSTGNHYRMRFNGAELTFEQLHLPGASPVTLTYRERELRPGLFLVSWIRKPGVHVSIIIDIEQRQVHVSAMMPPNQWEFFDLAEILSFDRG